MPIVGNFIRRMFIGSPGGAGHDVGDYPFFGLAHIECDGFISAGPTWDIVLGLASDEDSIDSELSAGREHVNYQFWDWQTNLVFLQTYTIGCTFTASLGSSLNSMQIRAVGWAFNDTDTITSPVAGTPYALEVSPQSGGGAPVDGDDEVWFLGTDSGSPVDAYTIDFSNMSMAQA